MNIGYTVLAVLAFVLLTAGTAVFVAAEFSLTALERSTVNVSQFSFGNTVTRTLISAPLNYQAGEGSQSSEYEIEIDGIITCGSVTARVLTFDLGLDGAAFGASFAIGAAYLVVNASCTYSIRFRMAILTAGAGGTAFLASDGATTLQGGGNQGNTNVTWSLGANSGGLTKSIDTTASHTLQVYGQWSGTSTGQGVTTYRTRVTRRM